MSSSSFRSSPIAAPLLALLAGALNVLAFAPFNFWPLQIATLALMFFLVLRESSIRRGALLGYAYGYGWTVCGVHWLYVSMHYYGGMPSWMAALAVALLGVLMGGFAALGMGTVAWLRQRWPISKAMLLLLVLPAVWALSEWLRGWVFTGFPWVVSGYAHNQSPLAGFAPLLGVYGIGWLAALIAGCLLLLPSKKRAAGFAAALVLLILGAGAGLKTIDWTAPNGRPISVRLVQGNVPQDVKFENDHISNTLTMYYEAILAAPADLIATPETAIPLMYSQLPPDFPELLSAFARKTGSYLTLGILVSDGPRKYANSLIGLPPAAGAPLYRYDKHHLVPFGEFIPWGFRWFVDMMRIPLGDQTGGPLLQGPFQVKDQWVLPNICYEDLFGEEIAAQLAAAHYSNAPQASLLLNISNIAWFGDSIALPQHLQISQMRALETGRPMLRATNTGATAVIDPKGRVTAQLAPFTRGVLSASVQGYRGVTPYVLLGNAPALALMVLMLVAACFFSRRYRRDDRNSHIAGKNR